MNTRISLLTRNGIIQRPLVILCWLAVIAGLPVWCYATEKWSDASGPGQISLEQLEHFCQNGSKVLSSAAALEEMRLRLEHVRARSGLRLLGEARTGIVREEYTSGVMREYYPSRLALGLSYPLFGKLSLEDAELVRAQSRISESRHRLELTRRIALETLRLNYITLWGNLEKIRLGQAFLATQTDVEHRFRKRRDAGYLLEADFLEFMSAYDLVARDVRVARNSAHRARSVLLAVTDRSNLPRCVTPPALPAPPVSAAELEAIVLSGDPELKIYQELVDEQLEVLDKLRWSDIKGDVTLKGFAGSSEYVYSDIGYGALVSMDIDLPLHFGKAESSRNSAELARLRRLQKNLQVKENELRTEALGRLRVLQASEQNRVFAARRLQAAVELLRMRTIQTGNNPGEVMEKLQQARYGYYRVAMDYIDAEIQRLQAVARILRFSEPDSSSREIQPLQATDPALLAAPEAKRRPHSATTIIIHALDIEETGRNSSDPAWLTRSSFALNRKDGQAFSVYFWRSPPLTDIAFFDASVWKPFQELRVGNILVSLNRKQIRQAATPAGTDRLQRLVRSAQENGISVGLLLGEPSWILPRGRQDLLRIIWLLRKIPFASLHLDLEPNQIEDDSLSTGDRLRELLRTLEAVREASPWPVELSLHPRYLEEDSDGFCLGCALEHLELSRIVLMIYQTNPDRVVQRIVRIHERFPRIELGIAQSVEPVLKPANSYGHGSLGDFLDSMRKMDSKLKKKGLELPIYIQDWTGYRQLAPATEQ